MIKVIILTNAEKTLRWRSLTKKLEVIKDALNSGKNADFTVDIQAVSHTPMVNSEKRIVHDWLNRMITPFFRNGYDILPFHMTISQKKAFGIKTSLRGSNPRTDDEMGDMYFFADELTRRNGFNQFIETCLHEIAHEYFAETGLPDITHEYHDKHGSIIGLFATLDWSLYQPRRMKLKKIGRLLKRVVGLQTILNLLTKIDILKKAVDTLTHPVPDYKEMISQPYGVINRSLYPKTGRHIGTDYACPAGTPVLAPTYGEVTVAGNSVALGNFCHYKFTHQRREYTARFLHLESIPKIRSYSRGESIGKAGVTGEVTGPHLHVDIWLGEVQLDQVNPKNWKALTVNPVELLAT